MVTLVDPGWVADRLDSSDVLVLDPRGRMSYLRGHLRGSISLPVTRLLGDDGRLLEPDSLGELFGAAGLGETTIPVLYDSYDGQRGAFMAWVLEFLGSSDIHLMDTFFEGWAAQGREVFYRPVQPVPRRFTARPVPAVRATKRQVQQHGGAALLDVRSVEEFVGQTELDARPGHIPGAKHIPWLRFLGDDHRFLDSDDVIGRRLGEIGISPNEPVITYCRVGIRAAVSYVALQRLGYDVRLYDGSYSEWQSSGLPVEASVQLDDR